MPSPPGVARQNNAETLYLVIGLYQNSATNSAQNKTYIASLPTILFMGSNLNPSFHLLNIKNCRATSGMRSPSPINKSRSRSPSRSSRRSLFSILTGSTRSTAPSEKPSTLPRGKRPILSRLRASVLPKQPRLSMPLQPRQAPPTISRRGESLDIRRGISSFVSSLVPRWDDQQLAEPSEIILGFSEDEERPTGGLYEEPFIARVSPLSLADHKDRVVFCEQLANTIWDEMLGGFDMTTGSHIPMDQLPEKYFTDASERAWWKIQRNSFVDLVTTHLPRYLCYDSTSSEEIQSRFVLDVRSLPLGITVNAAGQESIVRPAVKYFREHVYSPRDSCNDTPSRTAMRLVVCLLSFYFQGSFNVDKLLDENHELFDKAIGNFDTVQVAYAVDIMKGHFMPPPPSDDVIRELHSCPWEHQRLRLRVDELYRQSSRGLTPDPAFYLGDESHELTVEERAESRSLDNLELTGMAFDDDARPLTSIVVDMERTSIEDRVYDYI
ncbi:hypothetical protein FRB95_006654 [Tulasnella sp. JGI-2019a]|nr:hypothetical protein FRB95_006654 [Tulasnella sp. JGI-2019a]